LKNELDYFSESYHIASIRQDPNTGKYFSQYPFGVPLLWSPYFLIGHGIASISGAETNGYSLPYIYMICLGSAINAFIGLLLVYSMLKKYFKKNAALLSLITVWLASPLFYYMYFESSVSHSNSFLIFTLFIWFWHKTFQKRDLKQWILLGILAGVAMLVRYQNVMLLILPLCEVVPSYWRNLSNNKWKLVLDEFRKHILAALFS